MTAVIIFAGIIALYAFIESVFALAIMSRSGAEVSGTASKYTIVVASRNEQSVIGDCIKSLLIQNCPPEKIIIVDDHSDDNTAGIVLSAVRQNPVLEYVSCDSSEIGKRAALLKGILLASTETILTIDADCTAGPAWADTLLKQLTGQRRMITGPVVVETDGSCLSVAEYTESLYLVSGGAGASALGLTFQASGANMAFYKDDFREFYQSGLGAGYKCGDDVFFMQFLQHKYGNKSIGFSLNAESLVKTKASNSVRSWMRQRVRWAWKARGYSNVLSFAAGALVLLTNIAFVASAVFVFSEPALLLYALAGIGLKIMGDLLLLTSASVSWRLSIKGFLFLILPVIYPIFILRVMAGVTFSHRQNWKGRKIN